MRQQSMSLLSVVNRISLNGRLIGGFGLLMVLIGSTSIFYNVRIRDLRDNVTRIERASAATDTVGDFTRYLLLLRSIAVDYFRSGSAADRARTLAAFEPLDKSIERLSEVAGSRGDMLRTGLSNYHAAFNKLDEEIKKRQAALQAMNASGARLTNSLTTVTLDLAAAGEAARPAAQRLQPILRSPRSQRRCRRRSKNCWVTRINWSAWRPRQREILRPWSMPGSSSVTMPKPCATKIKAAARALFRPPPKSPRTPRAPARSPRSWAKCLPLCWPASSRF